MKVLVVLPTYDEAATISEVLTKVREALPDAAILVVDDGSPDGTAELAEKAGIELGGVDVMRRDHKRGLGDAYRAGFVWGMDHGYDALVQMDSDLSHDPMALPSLVGPLADFDLVIGSRYVPGGSIPNWGFHRRMLSKGGNLYSTWMLGVRVKDMTAGFRAYRADLLRSIGLDAIRADGYGFQIEMAYRSSQAGARILEVPIQFVDRVLGESKMSSSIVVEALLMVTRWGVKRRVAMLRGKRHDSVAGGVRA